MNSANTLSPRQAIIMQCLVDGLTVKEIAGLIHVTKATVRKHVNKASRKLGAKTHDHAIALAVSRGDVSVTLITPEILGTSFSIPNSES